MLCQNCETIEIDYLFIENEIYHRNFIRLFIYVAFTALWRTNSDEQNLMK